MIIIDNTHDGITFGKLTIGECFYSTDTNEYYMKIEEVYSELDKRFIRNAVSLVGNDRGAGTLEHFMDDEYIIPKTIEGKVIE